MLFGGRRIKRFSKVEVTLLIILLVFVFLSLRVHDPVCVKREYVHP